MKQLNIYIIIILILLFIFITIYYKNYMENYWSFDNNEKPEYVVNYENIDFKKEPNYKYENITQYNFDRLFEKIALNNFKKTN